MRVTIFISGVTGGGAEKVACAAAAFLAGRGHSVELLTMSDEPSTYPWNNNVLRTCLLRERERRGFLCNNTLRFVRFVKYLMSHKPDVYLAMLPTNIFALLSFKFLSNSKVIALERANPSSYNSKVQNKLRRVCNKADGWVFQTYEQEDWYKSKGTIKRCVVIPNAINPDVQKHMYRGQREKTITTAGRLTDQKNQLMLIEAFSRIASRYKDYSLVIYGDGPNRNGLTNRVRQLSLEDRIQFPGYVPDVLENVAKSSLFVLSSDYEGMPNALMEAMALGTPCISTDCGGGGARFLISNGKNGLLVPVKDVGALVNAMDMILSNKVFAESLGSEAHKLCEILSPETIYGRWETFAKEVVNK